MEILKLTLFSIFFISIFSFFSLAPWVPTKKNDIKRINDLIKLKKWEKFLEIWSWTALVSIWIAKLNPDSEIIWIELSPFLFFVSKIKLYFVKEKNIKIIYWNALKLDLSNFDVIYVFWLVDTISKKLYPKLKLINNKNFRFISYCFKFSNNKVFSEKRFKIEWENSIYVYKKN